MAKAAQDKVTVDLVISSVSADRAVMVIRNQSLTQMEFFALTQLRDDLRINVFDTETRLFGNGHKEDPAAYAS